MPSCRIWPTSALLVGQHQFGVDRGVELAVAVVDLQRREARVHAEGARLVGDDRHDPLADLLVAQQVLDRSAPTPSWWRPPACPSPSQRLVGVAPGSVSGLAWSAARARSRRARAAARAGTGSRARPGPGGSTAAGTGRPRAAASVIGMRSTSRKSLRSSSVKLLHLVRRVAALEVLAQAVALDGLGQDHRRLALVRPWPPCRRRRPCGSRGRRA